MGKMNNFNSKGLKEWGSSKTRLYLDQSRKYYWNLDQLNLIVNSLPLRDINSVLDLGTGSGYFAFYLRSILSSSANIIGLDIDSKLLHLAKKKASEMKLEVNFKKGDIDKLSYKSESFDLITEQLVLLHLENPAKALGEIYRCLKKGGYAVLVEPNNTAVSMVEDSAKRELSRHDLVKLTNLELAYNRGKNILGKGNSNIGDLLPKYLSQARLDILDVRLVDRVNVIQPPYTSEKTEIFNIMYADNSYNLWDKLYKDYCFASGMDKNEFKECWVILQKLQMLRRAQVKENKYYGLDTKVDYIYIVQKKLL